jgi:hypothetical protein
MQLILIVLVVVLILLQIVDALTTFRIVGDKPARELNPAVRWLMLKIGVGPALMVVKFLAVVAILVLWLFCPFWWMIPVYLVLIGLYGYIAWRHVLILNM